jgi:hypothetical protein
MNLRITIFETCGETEVKVVRLDTMETIKYVTKPKSMVKTIAELKEKLVAWEGPFTITEECLHPSRELALKRMKESGFTILENVVHIPL